MHYGAPDNEPVVLSLRSPDSRLEPALTLVVLTRLVDAKVTRQSKLSLGCEGCTTRTLRQTHQSRGMHSDYTGILPGPRQTRQYSGHYRSTGTNIQTVALRQLTVTLKLSGTVIVTGPTEFPNCGPARRRACLITGRVKYR